MPQKKARRHKSVDNRLGWHQDNENSHDSSQIWIGAVNLGAACDFYIKNGRDVRKYVLEHNSVLFFDRYMFHRVGRVHHTTEHPVRFNLTFRVFKTDGLGPPDRRSWISNYLH